jgi:alginate O-acetyltransferase complex protein AlgI
MTLFHIGIFLVISLLAGGFIPPKNRGIFYVIASILAIFWLQPASPIRHLDFWLPFTGLFLTVVTWFSANTSFDHRKTWFTLGIISILIFAICSLRYLEPACCITASRPPTMIQVTIITLSLIILFAIVFHFSPSHKGVTIFLGILILSIFILLKTEIFSFYLSKTLRMVTSQDQTLANALDIRWIGFSYLAFRLLHYLRDHQAGKIPSHSLNDFVAYALFFPAYTAGPIERFPRFLENIHKTTEDKSIRWHLSSEDFSQGSIRIVVGIFKKFVLADTLAIISLNSQNADQINSTFWAWLILYAYAFRIYFDFSGYTDIALGMARYMSIHLPENFTAPYMKTNLTTFWNSWHITLAQWFRAYVFNPLTRSMRTAKIHFPTWLIIISAQLCTMILIGLWHGVTINFAVWGLWHAIGLFVHNRWSDWRKSHPFSWENNTWVKYSLTFSSWFITFNYVVLGWVWFALPNPQLTWRVFGKLFGAG